jgi:asparagine synthase (glutamine-hydrolysing)
MCGIAGIVDFHGRAVREAEIVGMCSAITHRGPDGGGVYVSPGVGLGMRRLSIIDLVTGDQPLGNEDGTVQVVFNGEIYNYRELRKGLVDRGHHFKTSGDTEVLVHLYEERGVRLVDELRGMFAFAVWDTRRRRLLLGRDRLGIKPLYYTVADGRLLFASELKSLLAAAGPERAVNWTAFSRLLASLTTPGTESILAGIHKLLPGHVLAADAHGRVQVERYWDVSFAPVEGRPEEALVDELRALLDDAVRSHLVSDVPVGAFLSGGIDSSGVVAHMARSAPDRVKTFSIGFADADFSETKAARLVAARFGTEHHERILGPEALDDLEDIAWHLDEPFGDSSAIPTYHVSRLAAEHVKVVLSGDGGDELFGGYDRYVVEGRERVFRHVPSAARRALRAVADSFPKSMRGRRLLRHLLLPDAERYLDATTLFAEEDRDRLLRPEIRALLANHDPWRDERKRLASGGGDWLGMLQYLDVTGYLPLDILTKVDRMSMAHSLEARVPLLDHRLVELAATLPTHMKIRGRTTKYAFKRVLQGLVPDSILARPKRGFAVPLGRWFRGAGRDFVQDLLLSPSSRARDVFEPRALADLVATGCRRDDLGLQLWTVLSFELWSRTFLRPAAEHRRAV